MNQEQEQEQISDADLWERLVKAGKSPEEATALVIQRQGGFRGAGSSGSWEAAPVGKLDGMARAANQGMSFGLADEMSAALAAGGDKLRGEPFGESYAARVKGERDADRQFKGEHPFLGYGSEIAAGMMTGKTIPQFAQMGGVKGGAAMGAAYGAGTAEGGVKERTVGAAVGGAVGGTLGSIMPVARGVKRMVKAAPLGTIRDLMSSATGNPQAMLRLGAKFIEDAEKKAGVPVVESAASKVKPPVPTAAKPQTLEDIVGAMEVLPEAAPRVASLESRLGLDAVKDASQGAAKPWKPQRARGATKERDAYWQERMAKRQAAEAEQAEPALEDLLALSLEHIQKGGSLRQASDVASKLKIARSPK